MCTADFISPVVKNVSNNISLLRKNDRKADEYFPSSQASTFILLHLNCHMSGTVAQSKDLKRLDEAQRNESWNKRLQIVDELLPGRENDKNVGAKTFKCWGGGVFYLFIYQ